MNTTMKPSKARVGIRSNVKYVRDLLRQIEGAAKAGDWDLVREISVEASCAVTECELIASEVPHEYL